MRWLETMLWQRLHHTARQSADNGRLQPGTEAFNQKLKELAQVNNWDYGAALKVKANLVHAEGTLKYWKVTSHQV